MANFFDFFGRNKHNELERFIEIQVKKHYDKISFSLFMSDNHLEKVRLPVQLDFNELRMQKHFEQLTILNELYYRNWLTDEVNSHSLSLDKVYEMSKEERKVLNLPEFIVQLDLKLDMKGIIGRSNFEFELKKKYDDFQNLHKTALEQIGPFITLPNNHEILMNKQQFELEVLIHNKPNNPDDLFRYIAIVKNKAKKLNVSISKSLEKQEYAFIDDIDLDVDFNEYSIKILPKYHSTDNVSPDILDEMSMNYEHHRKVDGKRIFVEKNIQDKAKEINSIKEITGADIPRFIENPEAFIPDFDDIDLSVFSERVKNLGIYVYKAQPFIHANENNRGWFDLETGVSIIDDYGEIKEHFHSDEFVKLLEEAKEKGEEYIKWNDSYIKINYETDELAKAMEDLEAFTKQNKEIDRKKLSYVLEIFENIDELEYNQPFIDLKDELFDKGVLDANPPTIFGANQNFTLKSFQKDGYIWMKKLQFNHLGGLLADDMGLGKTAQVISFLSYLYEKEELKPTLIIVPKSLISNWHNELGRLIVPLKEKIRINVGKERIKDSTILSQFPVVITTYQTLTKDQLFMAKINWEAVICDEAQAIKNASTRTTNAVKSLKSNFRLAMTGTPVENSLADLWSIMDFVQPGFFGSFKHFKSTYIDRLKNNFENHKELENEITSKMSQIYLRRTKKGELKNELPSKNSIIEKVEFGEVQNLLYTEIKNNVSNKKISSLRSIQNLRMLCSHPALIDSKYDDLPVRSIPKLEKTIDILGNIRNKNEKVLIFTEYRKMQDILRNAIQEKFNIFVPVINGDSERRQEQVDIFQNESGFGAMILSPKAAGTGLTITAANHVIHYTRWWNPAVENQATDRAYRIGQTKDVTIYYPIIENSMEEIVHNLLKEKEDLAQSVIVPNSMLNVEQELKQELQIEDDLVKAVLNDYEKELLVNIENVLKNLNNKYAVSSKMRVADVLNIDKSNVSSKEFDFSLRAHFDFVVYNKEDSFPVLVMELDGKEHRENEEVMAKDELKNALCNKHSLSILRIPSNEHMDYKKLYSIMKEYLKKES